ncbi:lipase [Cinnamomum micranthum f. kanehirae]|uniref:Lipase n=1 Tax=Cinnamomum micranthum f. kanehirae TaxID=337451 RepID=A0A443PTP2_9MAGN|nr:lipase [Cinnamomum micranthum f. kanehirae]
MERFRWLKVVAVLICLFFAVSEGRELKIKHNGNVPIYNHTLATILVEYASAVYMSDLTALITWTCSRCSDMTEGFEVIELVVDVQHCLQVCSLFLVAIEASNCYPYCYYNFISLVTYNPDSVKCIQNWIEDLFWKQLDLNYPGMPDAMVHCGFYSAYHNTTLRPRVLLAVQRAKELYGDLGIMVTGHSMGGAMASFCALDLAVNQGEHNVQVMTFGQPRVGNSIFASYFSKHLPNTIRITNENDMVPHLPPYYTYFPHKTYHHFPREVWLYNIGLGSLVYTVEKICDASGEDPACCRSVSGNSIADHLKYFGVQLQAESWGSCRIVMVDRSMIKDNVDLNGNFALSRDPTTSVIKLSTEMDTGHRSAE